MKWGVRRYENPDGTLTEAGKKRYFNKKGKMRMRGYIPGRNRMEFEAMLRRSGNFYPEERRNIAKRFMDLSKWAKQNRINEDDYVPDYIRDTYLKNGRDEWGDPTGHSLNYRKKVVDYSNRYDKINASDYNLRVKERAYRDDAINNKLQWGKYTLQDYEHDFEDKKKFKR